VSQERGSRPKDTDLLANLGARLESRRRELGKSARETAKAAGISGVYLRVIETGRNAKTGRASRPSPEVLVRLARELDLAPDELLGLAGYDDLRVELETMSPEPSSLQLDSDIARALGGVTESLGLVQTRPSDFMRAALKDELLAFEANAHAIATGSLLATPDMDPRMRRMAFATSCSRTLEAVSFDDDLWWLGVHGRRYVELHAAVSKREAGVQLSRLFLLGSGELERYRGTLGDLVAAGVTVRVADPDDVADSSRRDFEIFDASILREATSRGAGTDALRFAEFTDEHSRLQRAESAFAAAWSRSTVFDG